MRVLEEVSMGIRLGNPLASLRADFDPDEDPFDRAVVYLLFIGLALRLLWLDRPIGSLIFDEKRP
ncbi:MAG: hypothetical protein QXW19_02315 [Candidatus Bathyarchaeia archaeon]